MAGLRTSSAVDEHVRERLNVAERLAKMAAMTPDSIAVASPRRERRTDSWATISFAELDADASRIARGLLAWGVPPGTRLALLVRPGIEFVALVFGLLRAGMVIVLVDPGLGRRNLVRCLSEAEPEGFVAIGLAQAARVIWRRKFPLSKWNVTVGRRLGWGGTTLEQLRRLGATGSASAGRCRALAEPVAHVDLAATQGNDPAAIIFTSGSTGPPKGVLYTQRMFDTQVAEIQAAYAIKPGGVDLACFPLFGLFNAAMGVSTVFPEMDFSRPALADPRKLLAAANEWRVTQAFASPAVWRVLGEHCARTGEKIESLRQVFSCGAPVGADVLRQTLSCVAAEAKVHTPYGATECLPVSTIEATEVLGETAARTDKGAGVCVGRKFDSIEWRVIRITDEPIATLDDAEELPTGGIGELIVRGPQASPKYATSAEHTYATKIADGEGVWHRMGDVGYFDNGGRFWYCGRKSQRVESRNGTLFTEQVEAIFNLHWMISRSALVGVGRRDCQEPVVVYEPRKLNSTSSARGESMTPRQAIAHIPSELKELAKRSPQTQNIRTFLEKPSLPMDVRHNAKIQREALAEWAAGRLRPTRSRGASHSHAERGNEVS